MAGTIGPTAYWATRTILSRSANSDYPLRLLHILIAPSGCRLDPNVLQHHAEVSRSELSLGDDKGPSRPLRYLLDQLATLSSPSKHARSYTFILPYASGYIIRSDFLRIRLQMLLRSHEVHSFREPLEHCQLGQFGPSPTSFSEILDTAVGVVSTPVDSRFDPQDLAQHLSHRLSYPWLSLQAISRKTIALLRGRPSLRVGGPVYSAAKALGVDLVIIDEDGHWLQADTPRNQQLREAFLTIDMREDDDLPNRIATAIQGYPKKIDGIFTLSDNYLVAVARSAEVLGLPTSPSSAYEVAYDKGLTRQRTAAPHEHATVENEQELYAKLSDGVFEPQYPLIVKPRTRGWNSQFVRKVRDRDELHIAVRTICPHYEDGVVIEPYYDGPEIDVNIVMVDGQVAFKEIVDEPPSVADLSQESSADFLENGMRAPSVLLEDEQQSIYASISENLLQLGFTNGVFHVEARISQTSMEYREENGSIDLVPTSQKARESVHTHVIEINARPPGLRAQILSQLTYGVDYFAARILTAVYDVDRAKAVAQPFDLPQFPQGAGTWSQLIHLPVLAKGKTVGIAGLDGLLNQLPDLAQYVYEYQSNFEFGDTLPDPAETPDFFGHVIVATTESRRRVVEIADEILRAYHEKGVGCTIVPPSCEQTPRSDSLWEEQELPDPKLLGVASPLRVMLAK